MDSTHALAGLSALAHDGRLSIFRLLVKMGPGGMAAGAIARKLGTAPNTLSPWTGLAVTVIWAVVMTVAAAIQLRRRDA